MLEFDAPAFQICGHTTNERTNAVKEKKKKPYLLMLSIENRFHCTLRLTKIYNCQRCTCEKINQERITSTNFIYFLCKITIILYLDRDKSGGSAEKRF